MWLSLLVFLLISSGCFAVLRYFMRRGSNREEDPTAGRRKRPLLFGALTEPLAGILPVRPDTGKQYTRLLRQAGHYGADALSEYLGLRNALVAGGLLLSVAAIVVLSEPGEPAMYALGLTGLLAVILLYAAPRLVLETMSKGRVRRIEESLPDAMDMITMCVSAGLPLQHAIGRVSEETRASHPDLSFELRIVGRHTEAGSLSTAIRKFAERLDVPEIHSVATMVWQAEQQGGSVAGAFQSFADQVRLNRRQRAEEAGNKAAFKMLFPLVFCLAPAVYIVLLGPAVMDIRDFFRREREPGGVLATTPEDLDTMLAPPPVAADPAEPAAPGE